MRGRRREGTFVAALLAASCLVLPVLLVLLVPGRARADLSHETVEGGEGAEAPAMELVTPGGAAPPAAFADLEAPRAPGLYTLRLTTKGESVLVPHCAGRGRVLVDGVVKDAGSKGPLVLRLGEDRETRHEVRIEVTVSAYEKRIACAEAPRAGKVTTSREGTTLVRFPSPHKHADAGQAVVFVPRGHDASKPGALLVGVHPWNGSPWTYAAYRELVEEAQAKDVVLVMPSGLGNSLYTADAEDEVMRAIDTVSKEIAIDARRVSIWGASMGGAGATTIAFHRPDRFAFVASYFGDSKYDLSTYVRSILGGEAGAHKVNALDVVENARHLPVLLVHGEADRTSPIVQSTMLFDAMKKLGFQVELERVPAMGHEGALVARYLRRVVARAAEARAPVRPARVSFRSVRGADTQAYGVRVVREGERDAFVDLEMQSDGVHVLRAEGVIQIVLEPGALGATEGAGEKVHLGPGTESVNVRWGR